MQRPSKEQSSDILLKRTKSSAPHASEENAEYENESDIGRSVEVNTHVWFDEEEHPENELRKAVENLDKATFIRLANVRAY